ncbi:MULTISPECIES: GGDEF domain-containing protein [unclassified Undibacterium]|uniref:GGDEF domain-containing protein n=1 Tax=unclassified Undibacterium TaxID=2630295 RepID=UPI002AC8D4B6|nr:MULTISPECIES: diguanylate cyclase [unclassified Undibacterium]MEB0139471.1 diguanylate cyclase [Undibacterium sp. CCC2.1]MEB0171647.1 diguanylate cyclase [Undibacterium sp. CCC1.1]MEB0176215.1 diguanylate cyclase [Undibacterium sp. CCC3.4]MEB0214992.1 diguanylate cyclase [Undibacterium sp. 5I2]WPX43226.1 diguanylate cyclase [Undibacterium sp. CCC3.4]
MSASAESASSTTILFANSGMERMLNEKFEAKISRFERMGVQLFAVANCFVSFGHVSGRSGGSGRSITEMEAGFSDSLALSEEFVVVPDLAANEHFASHRGVVGVPYIRFYVSYPIYAQDGKLIGCIRLLDYQVRTMSEAQHLLLTDLAIVIERELALGLIYQQQIELLKENRQLKRESLLDPLLGTWNKTAILRSLRIELDRCNKARKPLSLLLVYPDQLDAVRAQYGMALSDQILIRTVSRIRSCIRPFDALGRYGSDQLLVVLPGASHLVATAVAERIRLAITMHPEVIGNTATAMTICAGLAASDIFPDIDPETFISLAEQALLSARNAGNNTVVQAKPDHPDMII